MSSTSVLHLLNLTDILTPRADNMIVSNCLYKPDKRADLAIFSLVFSCEFLVIVCSLLVRIVLGRLSVVFFMTVRLRTSHKSMRCLQKSFSSNEGARHDSLLVTSPVFKIINFSS